MYSLSRRSVISSVLEWKDRAEGESESERDVTMKVFEPMSRSL